MKSNPPNEGAELDKILDLLMMQARQFMTTGWEMPKKAAKQAILATYIPKAEVLKELELEEHTKACADDIAVQPAQCWCGADNRNQLKRQIKSNLKLMETPSEY